MIQTSETTQSTVNWRQVRVFLGLTFGFTYLLDLLLKLAGGLGNPNAGAFVQLQMLLPAFFAIFLGMFIFKDSPFRVGRPGPDGRRDRARGFFYLYMALTLVFVVLVAISVLVPAQRVLVGALRQGVLFAGVLGLLLFRLLKGRAAFARASLTGGRFRDWIVYGGAIVLFFGLQTALSALFHLGTAPDLQRLMPHGLPMPKPAFMIVLALQTIVEGSLLGLVVAFGEEYGWRGFLQPQLIRLGKKRGILILGLIWGAWHYPIIWMGYNYPGYPVAGTAMMTLFTVLLAFVFGYAMLKVGSIWLVAFMHAVVDQTLAYFITVVYKPNNPIFSFGIGLYGLAMLAVIVALLLRDPVWKEVPAAAGEAAR